MQSFNSNKKCIHCKHLYCDNRLTIYRRDPMYFCRKKGAFYSRNYKIGEGTRISHNQSACEHFEKNE